MKVYKKGFTRNSFGRNRNPYFEYSKKGKEALRTVKMYFIPYDVLESLSVLPYILVVIYQDPII